MQRILIVDDDDRLRRMLARVLTTNGYAVELASNGIEALERFKTAPVELVVIDIFMPHKNGIETILDLRAQDPNVKIIAISGGEPFPQTDWLNVAKILGSHRILRKPFLPQDLLSAVAELLPRTPPQQD